MNAATRGVEDDHAADVALVLAAMAGARTAAPLVVELLRALPGWGRDRLEDALAEAEVAGLLEPWPDCPAGIAVVLSGLAADRLGLRLVGGEAEASSSGRFSLRWVPAGAKPRPSRIGMGTRSGPVVTTEADLGTPERPGSLSALGDPRAVDPLEQASGAEWLATRRRSAPPGRPGPTPQELLARGLLKFVHLRGLRETWSGELEGPCSCRDKPLGDLEFCCRCNRSGLDWLVGAPPKPGQAALARRRDPVGMARRARATVKAPAERRGEARAAKGREAG